MKKYRLTGTLVIAAFFVLTSCKKFLDIVPDNVATLDNAFARRNEAEKYLFTCYSYMPENGNSADDPAITAGDEVWRFASVKGYMDIARGFQNKVNPIGDKWGLFFRAIRDCNIFLENINKVPDMDEQERSRWIAEVKFLKAYYNFYLVRMYGPIPLMKENLSVDADVNQVNVSRASVDECFAYIKELIDDSVEDLPISINDPARELGRITQSIALSFKAQVLVTAASPLFNGNADFATFKNRDDKLLFNPSYSKAKWDSAAAACKAAVDMCHELGLSLYKSPSNYQQYNLTPAISTQLSIRNSIAEKWNSEVIWANTQYSTAAIQRTMTPTWDPANLDITAIKGEMSPPLKMAELFYTKNGVPINEDKTWDYTKRYDQKISEIKDNLFVRQGYVTALLNYDREPRFYADLGFDGGVWYGQGRYDDKLPLNLFYLEAKFRQRNGFGKIGYGTVTGYYVKKLIHFENVIGTANNYSVTPYYFPIMRLADLYLLYAEALNESEGPTTKVHEYINKVRERAGLPSVESAWTTYSTNSSKFATAVGMRQIIQQERLIELAFEGQRFWDLRRWKKAADELNKPILGWDLLQQLPKSYYRPSVVHAQSFNIKDYFWPIAESTLSKNGNLVQNPGW